MTMIIPQKRHGGGAMPITTTTMRGAVERPMMMTMMAPSIGRLANFFFPSNRRWFRQRKQQLGENTAALGEVRESTYLHATSSSLLRHRRNSKTYLLLASSSSLPSSSSSSSVQNDMKVMSKIQPRIDEPNLYDFPSNLHPTYGHVPLFLRALIVIVSVMIVERKRLVSQLLRPARLLLLRRAVSPPLLNMLTPSINRPIHVIIRQFILFAVRTAFLSTLATLAIQEQFFPPSRVTTSYLAMNGHLPSTMSKYSTVSPVAVGSTGLSSVPIGVHCIQYTQSTSTTTTANTTTTSNPNLNNKYDGIYFHHGFGASSLSWLPILPSLVNKLGKNNGKMKAIGIAHDAPGFGFTDRPDGDQVGGLHQYSTENNVGIGLALLQKSLFDEDENTGVIAKKSGSDGDELMDVGAKSIAIFGHSMGSKAALLMALYCKTHTQLQLRPNLVVLVAPALEGISLPTNNRRSSNKGLSNFFGWNRSHDSLLRRLWITWRKIFVDYPFQYSLRRVVCGTKDFWRKGLTLAWGDPRRLTDSDVLRFQWPSIGNGWERGLITFTRSRLVSSSDDRQLLKEVLKYGNVKVVIVYGSKDRVVRIEGDVAAKLKSEYPTVNFIRMEGLGHDPFEEDVEGFMMALEKVLT